MCKFIIGCLSGIHETLCSSPSITNYLNKSLRCKISCKKDIWLYSNHLWFKFPSFMKDTINTQRTQLEIQSW